MAVNAAGSSAENVATQALNNGIDHIDAGQTLTAGLVGGAAGALSGNSVDSIGASRGFTSWMGWKGTDAIVAGQLMTQSLIGGYGGLAGTVRH